MTQPHTNDYEIRVVRSLGPTDPQNDNVDVEVVFTDGRRFGATFITLRNIAHLMREYRSTGECSAGLYFWSAELIVIEDLTESSIERCVATLIEEGEFEDAFRHFGGETKKPTLVREPCK